MKLIFKYLKRFILGGVLIYIYNLLVVSLNLTIPINLFTITLVSFFDIPAIVAIIVFKAIVL